MTTARVPEQVIDIPRDETLAAMIKLIEERQIRTDTKMLQLMQRVAALESVDPPSDEYETLFHFLTGDLDSQSTLLGSVGENKRIDFESTSGGGSFSVSKSRPIIHSDGRMICSRSLRGNTSKQVQIRIIHSSFERERNGQDWYLPFGEEYRISLEFDYLGFPATGPGRAGNESAWSQITEGWGPQDGYSGTYVNPVWQVLAIGHMMRGRLDAGNRHGSALSLGEKQVDFDLDRKSLAIEYKPHPVSGYLRCPDVGLDFEGCTVLTHDSNGLALPYGPCINVGYYGEEGMGYAFREIKMSRKL